MMFESLSYLNQEAQSFKYEIISLQLIFQIIFICIHKYNKHMAEIQKDDCEENPLQNVLSCLKRKQINPKFSKYLSSFIKTNPSVDDIKKVSLTFLNSKKEGLHYRETTDLLVIMIKLLLDFRHSEQFEDLEARFNEKFQLFHNKLKRPQVEDWILALKKEVLSAVKIKERYRKREKDRVQLKQKNLEVDLAKQFQKIRTEKDELVKAFERIALIFFDYSEIERRTGETQFYKIVTKKIQDLKENLRQKQEAMKKQLKAIEKLKQLGIKNKVKSKEPTDIVKQLDCIIKQQAAKLSFINSRLEASKKNQNEKVDTIANLRIRLQKYDEEIRIQKNKVEQFQAKEQQIICKYFLNNSEILKSSRIRQITFLRSSINNITGVNGTKCKLLYSSNQPKCKNFHEFVDNKANILLLIQLKNGNIIGGFSHEQFHPPRCNGQKGFIFNLTKMERYQRQQRSTITYDDYYLIFGNSEICIKVNDMHMLSNFAIQSKHFNSKNRDIKFFLGSQSREVEMKIYEIYQVLTD